MSRFRYAAHFVAESGATDLVVQDAVHAHSVDNVALTQAHALAVADGAHAHTADSVVLTTEADLVIADANHAHSLDGLALTQAHSLAVADAIHGHSVDTVVLASAWQTAVTISGTNFLINGSVTYPGTAVEGLLINVRTANAAFDDENAATIPEWEYPDTSTWDAQRNVDEFCDFLPLLASSGVLMFTMSLQGGNPNSTVNGTNITSAYNADGSLKAAWKARVEQIIETADSLGMCLILTCFYRFQDHRLTNEAAVIAATDNVVDWIIGDKGYTNVMFEVVNEVQASNADQDILKTSRVDELLNRMRDRAQTNYGRTIYLGNSKVGTNVDDLMPDTDFALPHGNTLADAAAMTSAMQSLKATANYGLHPQPIVVNECSTDIGKMNAAIAELCSWGYHEGGSSGTNDYIMGFQNPPINWSWNTATKQAFRDRAIALAEIGDNLVVADASHAHAVDNVALTQQHELVVDDALHGHTIDAQALTQAHSLAVADVSHAHLVDSLALTQAHELVIADVLHAHGVDAPALTQAHVLVVDDTLHAHALEAITLGQEGVLSVADAIHAHSVEILALTQGHELAVAGALHSHAVDVVTLTQAYALVVADAVHAHAADAIALTQLHVLAVADALHAHTADGIGLTIEGELALADALHGHSVDSIAPGQGHVLTLDDALHGHSADNVALLAVITLVIADALHAHSADDLSLTQLHVLAVQDAVHAHLAGSIVLTGEVVVSPTSRRGRSSSPPVSRRGRVAAGASSRRGRDLGE